MCNFILQKYTLVIELGSTTRRICNQDESIGKS